MRLFEVLTREPREGKKCRDYFDTVKIKQKPYGMRVRQCVPKQSQSTCMRSSQNFLWFSSEPASSKALVISALPFSTLVIT
jgi:hypothetical protein